MNMCCNMHNCTQTHLVYFICVTVGNRMAVYHMFQYLYVLVLPASICTLIYLLM